MPTPRRWQDMRGPETSLGEVIDSFLLHRNDLSEVTAENYRRAIRRFTEWCERELERPPLVGDIEPGTIEAFLNDRKRTASAESARVAWVAFRSLARFLTERGIHHDRGDSMLRHVRQPKVKEERRRNLTDQEMALVIQHASEGESGERDHAIVMTLLGTGLRRAEIIGLRLVDLDLTERFLRVRASTSKSVHPREIAIHSETLKPLDHYVRDHRIGDEDADAPLFTSRRGNAMTGQSIKRLFDRLKARTGIKDLCAHMLRHTWATNFNRSGTGSSVDLQIEGGLDDGTNGPAVLQGTTTGRAAPRSFAVHRIANRARTGDEGSGAEKGPPQQRRVLSGNRAA